MIWLSMAEAILVISGIPENIPDNNLESTVILVVFDTDVQVEPKDSEAVIELASQLPKHRGQLYNLLTELLEVEQ